MVGGEGDDQVDVVPLQGAIVACYGGGGEGDDQRWGSGRGAIVLWSGGEGDDQVWGSGRGCHCRGAIVVCYGAGRPNFGGGRGDIAGCHCRVPLQGAIVGGGG